MNEKTSSSFILGFFIALGFIASSYLISEAASKIILKDQSIRVKGYSEKHITADTAQWSGSFAISAGQLEVAYESVKTQLDKVLSFLESTGIPRDQIEIQPVSTSFRYQYTEKGTRTNQIESYVLEQRISLTSSDVQLIDRISKTSTQLIKSGIAFQSNSPRYFFSKLNDLKISLLAEATKNALERAENIAASVGSSVGTLKSASQGVFQITPVNSTDVSDYGTYDTSSIDKTVKAVVTVNYYVEKS